MTAKSRDCLKPADLAGVDLARSRAPARPRARTGSATTSGRTTSSTARSRRRALVAKSGLKLLGLDSPSMDFMTSKELEAHKTLVAGGVAILESLDLSAVPDGRYELIALPLKMTGGDGSLVRAVLREL